MAGICVPVIHIPNNYPTYSSTDKRRIEELEKEIRELKKKNGPKEGYESTAQKEEKKKESVEDFVIDGITVHVLPSKKAQIESIFETLTKIPTGRHVLEELKQNKTEVFYENMRNTHASYSEQNNAVTVNSTIKQGIQEYYLIACMLEKDTDKRFDELWKGKNLDYASQLMLVRAEYADGYVQKVKICDELMSVGHDDAYNWFNSNGREEFAAYYRRESLSDVFKVAYTDTRANASIEYNLMTRTYNNFEHLLDTQYVFGKPDSLTPADIAKACGGDRIDGYEEFMNSKQARQVQPLTKKFLELYNAGCVARGAPNDQSLDSLTVQSLSSSRAYAFAQENIKDMGKFLEGIDKKAPEQALSCKITEKMLKSVEKINKASAMGKTNKMAELRVEALKQRMFESFCTPEAEQSKANNNMAQIAAIKRNRDR